MSLIFFDAFTRFGPKPNMHGAQPWSLDHLIEEMKHCSISGAMVSSTACTQYDAMLENRRLSQRLAGHDFLFPIWNVMPHWTGECPEPQKLADLMRETNVRAVTLYPKTNGWNILSAHSRPLLEALQRQRTLTILDLRSEIAEPELEQMAGQYHDLPILLVGVSWRRQRSILPLLLHHENLHIAFDLFQIFGGLEWLVQQGCEDRLVYASNATDMSMGAHRCYIDYADLPVETRAKIASGNLTRLLQGLKPPHEIVNQREDAIMTEARAGRPLSTRVLDFHAHILDEGLNGAGGAYTMFNGGPAGVWRLSRRLGVDGIGLTSWNGPVGMHADEGNTCTRAALDALPDANWGLATFDVVRDSAEQLRVKMEAVFRDQRFLGFKPYPYYGKHYDDPVYEPCWQFGNQRGLYALLHVNRNDLSEIDALCPQYPNMTFIVAHGGGSYPMADAAIEKARRYPNFMIEITLSPVCMGVIDYLARGAGADRMVYGSDMPMRDPRPQLGWVVFSRLTPDDKRRVLGLNGQQLLDRIKASSTAGKGSWKGSVLAI